MKNVLLTLIAGQATKEQVFSVDDAGTVRMVDESDWDGPITCVIERATVEVLGSNQPRQTLDGKHYLALQAEPGAIQDLVALIAAGKQHATELVLLAHR